MDVQLQLKLLREKLQEQQEKSEKNLRLEDQERIKEEIIAIEADIRKWEQVENSEQTYLQDPEIQKKLVREKKKEIEKQAEVMRRLRNPMDKKAALTAPIEGMNRAQRRKELKELRRRKKRSRQRLIRKNRSRQDTEKANMCSCGER